MTIKQLNPYLMFSGTATQAVRFYESALGAKTEVFTRFGDIPNSTALPENKDRVIHALLRIGEGIVMISDDMPGHPVAKEGNVHVCVDFDDVTDMKKKFEALSAGGKVTMAPHDTFWGATFGTLVDQFGVQWMFNCNKAK